MWIDKKTWGAAWFALALAALACGKTGANGDGSGETHFLVSCDHGCAGGLECLCGVCSKACDASADCSTLSASASCVEHQGDRCTTVTKACDVACDGDAACSVVSARHVCQDGSCRSPGGDTAGSSAGGKPSGGGTGPQLACASCDDADCAAPGMCSQETACALVDCNSVLVDEAACYRPACTSDQDCAEDTRCTVGYVGKRIECVDTDGACACSTALSINTRQACSPTALAGARGTWKSITVQEISFDVDQSWQIEADGALVHQQVGQMDGTTTRLDSSDLDQLTFMVNGPDLRRLLADDDLGCAVGVQGYDVKVTLELDSSTLSTDVTHCVSRGPDAIEPFPSLLDLVKKY